MKVVKNLGLSRHAEGYVCGCLGEDCQCLGDYEAAIDYHEASVSIFKEVGDRFKKDADFVISEMLGEVLVTSTRQKTTLNVALR